MNLRALLALSEAEDSKLSSKRSKAKLGDRHPDSSKGEKAALQPAIRRAGKDAARRAKDAANRGGVDEGMDDLRKKVKPILHKIELARAECERLKDVDVEGYLSCLEKLLASTKELNRIIDKAKADSVYE